MAFLPLKPCLKFLEARSFLEASFSAIKESHDKYTVEASKQNFQVETKALEKIVKTGISSCSAILPSDVLDRLPDFIVDRYFHNEKVVDEILDEIQSFLCDLPQVVWTDAFQNAKKPDESMDPNLTGQGMIAYCQEWDRSRFDCNSISGQETPVASDPSDDGCSFELDALEWLRSDRMGIPLFLLQRDECDFKEVMESVVLAFSLIPFIFDVAPKPLEKGCHYSVSAFADRSSNDDEGPLRYVLVDTCQFEIRSWQEAFIEPRVALFVQELSLIEKDNRLARATALLGKAIHARRVDLKLILAVSVLETLCGLKPDDQIQKNVQRCMSLLFSPQARKKKSEHIHKCQTGRNIILHGREEDIAEWGDGNDVVKLAAECILRRAAFNQCFPDHRESSMVAVLEMYLQGQFKQLNEILDDDVLARGLSIVTPLTPFVG